MILGIYGAGGLGREIYDVALRRNAYSPCWDKIIFIDDFTEEGPYWGTQKVNFSTVVSHKNEYECVIAVGEPSSREMLYKKLLAEDVNLTSLIDPTAIISPTAIIQKGAIVCEYSTIHTAVTIGTNTLIQPFCNIGHDIKIGEHSVLSTCCVPGGGTVFGDRVFVGLQVALKESLHIGDDAIVGMGSVVYRDVPAGATVVGNPARITRGNDEHKVFNPAGKL
jgi:sugar O-acyltransferase (sialic acid O-acetyltransferase NeuD family)